MKTIWKYRLSDFRDGIVPMPSGGKVLSTAMQDGAICVWVEVDTKDPRVWHRQFWIIGTGWDATDRITGSTYVGTVLDGPFVWHVYDAGNIMN